MADEINFEWRLRVTNGTLSIDSGRENFTADMAGDAIGDNVQSIPTTSGGTAVTIPAAIGSAGVAVLENLEADGGNYVTFGLHDGSANYFAFVKVLPGEQWVMRLGGNTLYALANTGAVRIRTRIVEV